MKLLVLTAIIAAVASSPLVENPKWPWQVGKEYVYEVNSYTWNKFENSDSNGNAFKTNFMIRVLKSGQLLAKLENPVYGLTKGQMGINEVPSDLQYQPVQGLDSVFELIVDGGRVLSLKVPNSVSIANENLLKGLISALQVDLSTYGHVHNFPNSFDKETFQGLFKKMETDVTGDCETLYSISPVAADIHRILPAFAEDPIEITKSKNYGSCRKRAGFAFGVPEGAVWNGIAYENDEKQFIKHTSESRIFAGKQGTIYKTEFLSSVFVNPLLFGKQKAQVYSFVGFTLTEVKPVGDSEWKTLESGLLRESNSLLFTNNDASFFQVNPENVVNAQKLLQDMTPLLQDPSNLPKADFLSKFNLLVRFIMFMDADQLSEMTSSIEVAKESKNASKNKMWIIYRDAVAQAGSIAAFEEIRAWILAKIIRGEEAAEVITSVAGSLSFHTEKVTRVFYELAFNPAVMEQRFLNTSALLAVTKFLRSGEQDLFVVHTVIPRLSQELKKAVEEGDSSKAQVYVRTLGNLARPEILKVFAPYLEGHIAVTKYLRTQIIISLKTLANLKNEEVRAVLFSILRNTAEPYEVRVAAALNIFLAFPTAEMMQVMAHMTNDDPSTQVRGVLATSIGFAANLKDPRFAELAKTAQSVSNLVAKEKFGYRNSADSIIDEYTSNDELAHFRELSFIGSENSPLPKYQRQALRLRGTGYTEEDWFTVSVSDVQHLFDFIKQTFYERSESDAEFKFSAKQIIEELNIKRQPRSPLEGHFFIDNLNQQKLITFNERELTDFISEMGVNLRNLFSGLESQYTKLVIDKQVIVTFPLAAGMPFVFAYSEPIVLNFQLKSSTKLGMEMVTSFNTEIDFIYARNLDGSVGFWDTLSGNYASTGVVNKFQINIPIKINTKTKTGDLKFTFKLPEKDANLIHLSVWPYTTVQKMNSPLTAAEEPATKLVKRSTPAESIEMNVADYAGVGLYLMGHSYSSDYKKDLFTADILTNIRNLLYQKDIACTKFELTYVASMTKNKDVTTTMVFDTLINQKESGELGPATITSDVSPNSEVRRKELVKRVASGIDSAKVRVIDVSAVFDGQEKTEFVFTAALANSVVDNKVQAAVFAKAIDQINAVFKLTKPKIAPLNFEEALKNEIKVLYEADFKFGNSENIHFKGFGERSEQYTEQLKKDPLAKQCLQETSQNNFYQKDCYKMIIKAHAPDHFKASFTYNHLNLAYLKTFEKIKNLYNHFTTWEEQEDLPSIVEDGKFDIEGQAFYYDNLINYKFSTKYGVFNMKNAEGRSYYPYAMAIYAPITNWERSYNWFTGYQHMPYCAVDSSKIWTFSGRSYDYSLTSSWHAVMVDESNDFGKWTDLAILARRPSNNQEEVYISYKTETGKYIEIEIKPTAVEVKSNGEKFSEGEHTIYWDTVADSALLEYYTLAEGVQVFLINNEALRIVYDSQRLIIFTADHRSTTRGICGQSTSQTRDDYLTPYGLVDQPELYGASFSLDGEFSDPKTVELKKEAKLKAYQPVTRYTNILRSDAEWSKSENESVKDL